MLYPEETQAAGKEPLYSVPYYRGHMLSSCHTPPPPPLKINLTNLMPFSDGSWHSLWQIGQGDS